MMHKVQGNSLSTVAFKVHKTTRLQHLLARATAFLIPKLLAVTIFHMDTTRLDCNRNTTLLEERNAYNSCQSPTLCNSRVPGRVVCLAKHYHA